MALSHNLCNCLIVAHHYIKKQYFVRTLTVPSMLKAKELSFSFLDKVEELFSKTANNLWLDGGDDNYHAW